MRSLNGAHVSLSILLTKIMSETCTGINEIVSMGTSYSRIIPEHHNIGILNSCAYSHAHSNNALAPASDHLITYTLVVAAVAVDPAILEAVRPADCA